MSNAIAEALEARQDRIWRALRLYGLAVIAMGVFIFGAFDVGKQLWLRAYGVETNATITNISSMWVKNSRTWTAEYVFTSASAAKVVSSMGIYAPTVPPTPDWRVRPGEYRDSARGGRVTVIYAKGWPRFHIVKSDRYNWSYALLVYPALLLLAVFSFRRARTIMRKGDFTGAPLGETCAAGHS